MFGLFFWTARELISCICENLTSGCCSGTRSVWYPSVMCNHSCVFCMCIFLHLCLFALAFLCAVINSVSQDCLEFLLSWPGNHNEFFYHQQTSSTHCSFSFHCLTWMCQIAKVWARVLAKLHWWPLFAPRRDCLLLSLPGFHFSTIYLST